MRTSPAMTIVARMTTNTTSPRKKMRSGRRARDASSRRAIPTRKRKARMATQIFIGIASGSERERRSAARLPRQERDEGRRQLPEGHRLEEDLPGARERRDEESFPAEERGLDPSDGLDVVRHGRLPADRVPRAHLEGLARPEVVFDQVPRRVDEHVALAPEALEDEPLSPEEHSAQARATC